VNALYETEALQYPDEINEFVKLVRGERCNSYLEIGSKFGGSLWRVGQVLEPNSRIVAVDLPGGTIKWHKSEPSLKACADRLRSMGHRVTLIWGNSADDKVIEQVKALAPFDLTLIDGDHRAAGLSLDWHNYGAMAKIVAFHDIGWKRSSDWKEYPRIDVPLLWESLRTHYRSVEIKLDPSKQDNGIGVLWREDHG
jgi:Methyltransferase domain